MTAQFRTLARLALILPVFALGACDGEGRNSSVYDPNIPGATDEGSEQSPAEPPAEIAQMFMEAAEEFEVPSSILKGVSQIETSWQMVQGYAEFEGQEIATGIMALRGVNLSRGAELAGVSISEASTDPFSNIRAAAALLSDMADELGVEDRSALDAWAPVLAVYSGIEGQAGQDAYVFDDVLPAASGGPVGLEPIDPGLPLGGHGTPTTALQAGPDYPASVWRPSPNNSSRPNSASGDPEMVIIHTCEGSYAGCWSWLTNGNAGVSAHYVINNSGSEVSQLVRENRKAWHIGSSYDCSLNNNTNCNLNGNNNNNNTIGIEHAGYASQDSWDPNLIDTSAELVCNITQDNGIPRDQYHIVGHGQLQPFNRVDPGANWPWQEYLALVDSYCGDGPAPDPEPEPEPEPDPDPEPEPEPEPDPDPVPEPDPDPDPDPQVVDIIIDSNQGANDANASIHVSDNWVSSGGPTQYNTGYWWHSTQNISDAAEFAFYLDAPAELTVEAWWTAGANRSQAAPYLIYNSSLDHLDTVYVDQTNAGGQWNALGTYQFEAGWNFVDLSVWAPLGKVVIADAVRVHNP